MKSPISSVHPSCVTIESSAEMGWLISHSSYNIEKSKKKTSCLTRWLSTRPEHTHDHHGSAINNCWLLIRWPRSSSARALPSRVYGKTRWDLIALPCGLLVWWPKKREEKKHKKKAQEKLQSLLSTTSPECVNIEPISPHFWLMPTEREAHTLRPNFSCCVYSRSCRRASLSLSLGAQAEVRASIASLNTWFIAFFLWTCLASLFTSIFVPMEFSLGWNSTRYVCCFGSLTDGKKRKKEL